MSKSPRALRELMTAVDVDDAGHAAGVINVDSASWDSSTKLVGSRRRRPTAYYDGRRGGGARKSAPAPAAAVAVVEASSDASFEFSTAAVVSYSPASPASMVFSDGQLCAHQFPAVRSSAASAGQATTTSPVRMRSSSNNGSFRTKQQQAAVTTAGSKKRVSFATDGADKAAAAAAAGKGRKKSGSILGCMGSPCGASSRNEAVVEPVARNDSRKMVAF